MRLTVDERIRLSSAYDLGTGCLLWYGDRTTNGYARLWINGHTQPVHRWVYEQAHGPIESSKQIGHICRVRNCINVAHLRAVTCRENVLASGSQSPTAQNAKKTHCIHGHILNGNNLYFYLKRGERYCRICQREAAARLRRKAS